MKKLLENPLLVFLISPVRHVIVTGLGAVVTFMKMPPEAQEQVIEAADFTAPLIVSFFAWLVLKHGKPLLQRVGYLKALTLLVGLGLGISASACSVAWDAQNNKPIWVLDPAALSAAAEEAAKQLAEKQQPKQGEVLTDKP